jgi:hypothetical protein
MQGPLTPEEKRFIREVAQAMQLTYEETATFLRAGLSYDVNAVDWDLMIEIFRKPLNDGMVTGYREAALRLQSQFGSVLDEADVVALAEEWAAANSDAVARSVVDTTRQRLARRVERFFSLRGGNEDPPGEDEIEEMLAPEFGPTRAAAVAVTEYTRADTAGILRLKDEFAAQGVQFVELWYTAEDDRVCPICGPNHGKRRGDGWDFPPPAHPRCRCAIVLELVEDS